MTTETGGLIAVGVVILIGVLMRLANRPDDFTSPGAAEDRFSEGAVPREQRDEGDSDLTPEDEAMLD